VADDAPVEVPLTPMGWLAQNAVYLVIIAAVVFWLVRTVGWGGLPSAGLTVLGVGFIIFIHELGHFLVAKWCDVHVLTFSIGFGPALPGCSFKRGETTYKLSLLPLGGYVNMVGEGTEADENEDYPRSFKNKSVGQRMAIISAGVIMNVLLGFLCFLFVYRVHGVERTAATVWRIDPGSPAWKQGVHTGWEIVQIGSKEHPYFDYLQQKVALSGKGNPILFVFKDPDHPDQEKEIDLVPVKEEGSLAPKVGIASPSKLELQSERLKRIYPSPVLANSAAAAARVVDFGQGDVVLASTDPDAPDSLKALKHDLKSRTWDYDEFGRRLRRLVGKPLNLRVLRKGKDSEETVEIPADAGFHFSDVIYGCTEPQSFFLNVEGWRYDPFRVSELPMDKRNPNQGSRDPFVFRWRMRELAGKPAVFMVRRQSGQTVLLFVPPAYHKRFGARMQMGKVAAVRDGSPAVTAQLQPGDVITGVRMTAGGKEVLNLTEAQIDPVQMPAKLVRAARQHAGDKMVELTVLRRPPGKDDPKRPTRLKSVKWDENWDDSAEAPFALTSPLSIPQLGVAYWVDSKVAEITEGGPAAHAGLKKDDEIVAICFKEPSKEPGQSVWGRKVGLQSERGGEKVYDEWAQVFDGMQSLENPEVALLVKRGGELHARPIIVTLEEDPDWPQAERGLILLPDQRLVKAGSLWEALEFGAQDTWQFITTIYLGLSRMITGQVSTKSLGGPIEIVSSTFTTARDDIYRFILFLGFLSINLAVVNFLPIPLLDGGHMVFLIYEKIRGKPASESVRAAAAYIGLALLLALMVYVFYLDLHRRGVW
jgi:regulator of sigma E protease